MFVIKAVNTIYYECSHQKEQVRTRTARGISEK